MIEKVIIRQSPSMAKYRIHNDPNRVKLWTADVALMSMQYAIACMLVDGGMFINQLKDEKIRDPRILELAKKVEVRPTPEFEKTSVDKQLVTRVEVTDKHRTYKSQLEFYPKGYPENPMTKEERFQKFRTLARTVFQDERIEQIARTIRNLEEIGDIATLAQLLVI
jgi:2-methylcitrate dehydratase PrpD